MKHYITKTLVCLCMAIFVFNCQKEDDNLQEQNKTTPFSKSLNLSRLNTKAIKNDKNLMRIITKAETKRVEAKANKTVYNAQYDFTINTSYAKVITSSNGLKNYTFGVYRTEDNSLLENLLLKEQEDNTFKVFLVQYNITTEERNTLANQEIVDIEDKITYVPLEDISDTIFDKVNSDAETCTVYSYEFQAGDLCHSGQHDYADGAACDFWSNPDQAATSGGWVLTSNEVSCTGGNSTGDTDPNSNSTNPNQTTSNGGGDATNEPSTTPVLCTDCPPIEEDCIENEEALLALEAYFGVGNVSQNCSIDTNKTINFANIQEAIEFFEDLKTIDLDESGDEEESQNGELVTNFRGVIRDIALNKLTIDIDLKFIPDDYDTDEDEYQEIGIFANLEKDAILFNWSMTQGAPYYEPEDISQPYAKVLVINLFIEGKIGFADLGYDTKSKIKVKCKFNKYTGQKISFQIIE